MDSFKNFCKHNPSTTDLPKSRTHYFFTIPFTLILIIFFFLFSAADITSPAISSTSLAARIHCPPTKFTPLSSAVLSDSRFASQSCTLSPAPTPACNQVSRNAAAVSSEEIEEDYCDIFDGGWVLDEGLEPVYKPGSCPFVDVSFDCFKNGRPDSDYLRLKWKPHACEIPRFFLIISHQDS